MSLPNYDAWLVGPSDDHQVRNDAYMDWCEERGIDPDKPISEDFYLSWLEGAGEPELDDEPYEDWGFGD